MVVAIMGIVALFALPQIDLAKYRIEGAMQGGGSTQRATRRLALTRQQDIIVSFDVAASAIVIHEDANANGTVETGERVRRQPLGEQIVFGRGLAPAMSAATGVVTFTQLAGGLPSVTFHRSGSASEAGLVYLTSQRARDHNVHPDDARVIEVERATGRVGWYRYLGSTWQRRF